MVDDAVVSFGGRDGVIGRPSILVDNAFGVFELLETEEPTRRQGSVSWFRKDYAERMKLRRFLHYMRGRDGIAYFENEQDILKLNAGFAATDTAIDVQPIKPAADMVGELIRILEGEIGGAFGSGVDSFEFVIEAVDVSPTSQILTLGTTIGRNGTANAQVSIAELCRFDTDVFEFEYLYSKDGLMTSLTVPILETI